MEGINADLTQCKEKIKAILNSGAGVHAVCGRQSIIRDGGDVNQMLRNPRSESPDAPRVEGDSLRGFLSALGLAHGTEHHRVLMRLLVILNRLW